MTSEPADLSFKFDVPSFNSTVEHIELPVGTSTFFVGANGSGKTRLAARAEAQLGAQAHRIAAHRSLNLNPRVAKISERQAKSGLRFGYVDANEKQAISFRRNNRWGEKAETFLLNDFDFLVQALFAEQSNVALDTHLLAHSGNLKKPNFTIFQKLTAIWDRILPHRRLIVTGDDIQAASSSGSFSASDMSDGERAVFYTLGQILVAEKNSVLIFDEPELHVHRSILARLWDEAEAARPDCAFLVISHDLDFASSRPGNKYVIREYQHPDCWDIRFVPEVEGFDEDTATLILGSRKPILFVEGSDTSLDLAIYRACYSSWTVVPRGACENVIHAVVTMRQNSSLTRIRCAGIVDADDYSDEEKNSLKNLGIVTLPVSEIENIFLLPSVMAAILKEEKFSLAEVNSHIASLEDEILEEVQRPGSIEAAVLRYCRRRIDRTLKKIDLKHAKDTNDLANTYKSRTSALDIDVIANEVRDRIHLSIRERDLPSLLANFDNKGLLALGAKHLKGTSKAAFESWIMRAVRNPSAGKLRTAIGKVLPKIVAE